MVSLNSLKSNFKVKDRLSKQYSAKTELQESALIK